MPRVALLRRRLIEATTRGQRLVPVGRGTRGLRRTPLGSSAKPPVSLLATEHLARIDAIDEAELILTAEAGVALETLEAELAPRGLVLPPLYPSELLATLGFSGARTGTLGGLYNDPRELPNFGAWGRLRDQALGVEALRGDGTFFKAGGRVVKNVTGYDLTRFLCGSRGRCALTTRLHLKLERCPQGMRCLRLKAALDARFWKALAAVRAESWEPPLVAVHPGEPGTLLFADWGKVELVEARLERCGRSVAAALHRPSLDLTLGPADAAISPARAARSGDECSLRIRAPLGRWCADLLAQLAPARLDWQWIFPFAHFGLASLGVESAGTSARARLNALNQALRAIGGSLAFERLPNFGEPGAWLDSLEIGDAPTSGALARIEQRLLAKWDPAGVLRHNSHVASEILAP